MNIIMYDMDSIVFKLQALQEECSLGATREETVDGLDYIIKEIIEGRLVKLK